MSALTLGLIGNGAIARQLASYCAADRTKFQIIGALVKPGYAHAAGDYPLVSSLLDLVDLGPSLIVECAGHEAVSQYGARILRTGTDLVLVSTGSLCDENLLVELRRAEAMGKSRLILVAGALPGLDTLRTAALAGLDSVVLRSSKPPAAWRGTLAEEKHDLAGLQSATVIFEGSARDAALLYPKNANIAATAALAGIGFEKTHVVLTADPGLSQNVHRLDASGAFGQFSVEIKASPSPDNPKTSLIVGLSVLKILEQEASSRRDRLSKRARSSFSAMHNSDVQKDPIIGGLG